MIVLKTVISSESDVEGKTVIYDTLSDNEAIKREGAEVSQSHGWDTPDSPLGNITLTMYNLKPEIDQFIRKNLGKSFECKSKYSLEDFTFSCEASRMMMMTLLMNILMELFIKKMLILC